jgi:hypothetical protein
MTDPQPSYRDQPQTHTAGTPPPQVPTQTPSRLGGSGGRSVDLLLAFAAPALTLLIVGLAYALLRWAPDPVETALIVSGGGLVVLAACGFLAARRGVVAPYVAVALMLPFMLAVSAGFGSAERISSELEGFFDDEGTITSSDSDWGFSDDTDDTEAPDPAESAVTFGSTGEFNGYEVTVSSMECGLTEIDGAAENPDYYDSVDAEQYVTAKPASGKTFCVIASTWTNVSKEPASLWSHETFSGLITSDGVEFAPTSEDESYSSAMTSENGYASDTLNPGDSAEILTVFSLPEETAVAYLKAADFMDSEGVTFFEAPAN